MQEVGLLLAYRFQLDRQSGVLVAALLGLCLRPGLILVGADLGVDSLNIPDAGLQFISSLVLKVKGRLLGSLVIGTQGLVPFFQQCQLFAYPIHFRRQLSRPFPLALVLAVPGQDVLLAPNEVIGGNRLGGGLGVAGQLLGILCFLIGNLADSVPLVI